MGAVARSVHCALGPGQQLSAARPGLLGGPEYIDSFAWFSRHELRHVAQLVGFWGNNDHVHSQDLDADYIADVLEPVYGRGVIRRSTSRHIQTTSGMEWTLFQTRRTYACGLILRLGRPASSGKTTRTRIKIGPTGEQTTHTREENDTMARVQVSGGRSAVCVALLILMFQYTTAAEPVKITSGQRVAALRNARRLTNVAERCDACLALLKQEMQNPCTASVGVGGGPMDTGYVQNVIMGSFIYSRASNVPAAERTAVREWAKAALSSETDKGLRDRLTLVIAHTGDKSVVPQVIEILRSHPEGHMRTEAAMALYDTKDASSIPALRQALAADTYARVRTGGSPGSRPSPNEAVYSPVRNAAAIALQLLGESVPTDAELVDAKYVVPRLEPLLYSNPMPFQELDMLAWAGGTEGESAINRFIEANRNNAKSSSIVEHARSVLARSKAAQASK